MPGSGQMAGFIPQDCATLAPSPPTAIPTALAWGQPVHRPLPLGQSWATCDLPLKACQSVAGGVAGGASVRPRAAAISPGSLRTPRDLPPASAPLARPESSEPAWEGPSLSNPPGPPPQNVWQLCAGSWVGGGAFRTPSMGQLYWTDSGFQTEASAVHLRPVNPVTTGCVMRPSGAFCGTTGARRHKSLQRLQWLPVTLARLATQPPLGPASATNHLPLSRLPAHCRLPSQLNATSGTDAYILCSCTTHMITWLACRCLLAALAASWQGTAAARWQQVALLLPAARGRWQQPLLMSAQPQQAVGPAHRRCYVCCSRHCCVCCSQHCHCCCWVCWPLLLPPLRSLHLLLQCAASLVMLPTQVPSRVQAQLPPAAGRCQGPIPQSCTAAQLSNWMVLLAAVQVAAPLMPLLLCPVGHASHGLWQGPRLWLLVRQLRPAALAMLHRAAHPQQPRVLLLLCLMAEGLVLQLLCGLAAAALLQMLLRCPSVALWPLPLSLPLVQLLMLAGLRLALRLARLLQAWELRPHPQQLLRQQLPRPPSLAPPLVAPLAALPAQSPAE